MIPSKPEWGGLVPREVSFEWDEEETGQRYEVLAAALYPNDEHFPPNGPIPSVRILHVRDLHGREVAGELFGTTASIAIRKQAASYLEGERIDGLRWRARDAV